MSVTAARGFIASGVAAGLKASGKPDVALVVNSGPRFRSRWCLHQQSNQGCAGVVVAAGHEEW